MRFGKPGTGQQDLISQIEHAEKLATEKPCSLDKLNAASDFEIFRGDLPDALGYRDRKDKGGNAPFDPVFMFRIIVLRKYFALSEEQTEFQIRDRFSFMRFLSLRPGDEVPDKNPSWTSRTSWEPMESSAFSRVSTGTSPPSAYTARKVSSWMPVSSKCRASATAAGITRPPRKAECPKSGRESPPSSARRTPMRAGRRRTARPITATRTTSSATRKPS